MNKLITVVLPFVRMSAAFVFTTTSSSVVQAAGCETASFGEATDFNVGTGPLSAAVGDFNRDGTLDLAVANGNSNSVSILLGTGTGSFGTATHLATGASPVSGAVGDFDGDGTLDLAVVNVGSNNVSILINRYHDGGGCSIGAAPSANRRNLWLPLVPAAVLWWTRRRRGDEPQGRE